MAASPPPSDAAQKRRAARSRKVRLLAQRAKAARHVKIFNMLAAGMPVSEIALREGISLRRMRATIQELLARREADPHDGFAQFQIARLNDAMMIAHTAMMEGNLQAVDRVVKLVHELERYHGFRLVVAAPAKQLSAPEAAPALLAPPSIEAVGNGAASP